MDRRMFGINPLSEKMPTYYQSELTGLNFCEITIKLQQFSFTKMTLRNFQTRHLICSHIHNIKWRLCPVIISVGLADKSSMASETSQNVSSWIEFILRHAPVIKVTGEINLVYLKFVHRKVCFWIEYIFLELLHRLCILMYGTVIN